MCDALVVDQEALVNSLFVEQGAGTYFSLRTSVGGVVECAVGED